ARTAVRRGLPRGTPPAPGEGGHPPRGASDVEILDRLAAVEQKFEQLAHQMSDPALTSDQDRYRQVTKAYAELEKTVTRYREYKDVARQIQESQALMQDEELRAMARESTRLNSC